MSRDDSRNWILERRGRLLAAAAASAGIALAVQACEKKDEGPPPGPCLSIAPADEDAGPPPEPCLQPPPPEVCLSPRVCLEFVPPDDPPKKDGPFAEPPPGKS